MLLWEYTITYYYTTFPHPCGLQMLLIYCFLKCHLQVAKNVNFLWFKIIALQDDDTKHLVHTYMPIHAHVMVVHTHVHSSNRLGHAHNQERMIIMIMHDHC